MLHPHRSAFAGSAFALAFGLLLFVARAADGDEPPKKAARPSQSAMEVERFRALGPAERLKLVEKLAGAKAPFAPAKRSDLVTAVVERGTVESADYVDLICKVKAKDKQSAAATINWVIEDGSMVKKGDRIAILDDSALQDQLRAAAAKVKEAGEALDLATENVRLVRQEHVIEVRLAEIDVKLAEIELKNLPAEKSKEVPELKVEQAKLKLERAVARAKAQQAQAEADKRAKTAAKELEIEQRESIVAELKHCVLVAPQDGVAIYYVPAGGRFGGVLGPIAMGDTVREGQKLLRVAGLKKFVITTQVHESQVSALRVGQATQMAVDAFPNKSLRGKVAHVSPVASEPNWRVADIKVYPVTIAIEDAPEGLKPDMTVTVQIATGERKGVLQVPRTTVLAIGREQVCFIKSGQELQERKVVIGAGNATAIEIKEGLKENDLVVTDLPALLVRP